jgi:hypothetical protein
MSSQLSFVIFVSRLATGKASVMQHIVQISFLSCSLKASTQCGAISKALSLVCLNHHDVTSASIDGCSTNVYFVKIVEEDQDAKWVFIRCFAHCVNNAGK